VVGDAATFAKGRDLAAWLDLVPRQATTGGRLKLLGITKRGSRDLREMLGPVDKVDSQIS
jgi:transposase